MIRTWFLELTRSDEELPGHPSPPSRPVEGRLRAPAVPSDLLAEALAIEAAERDAIDGGRNRRRD